MVGVKQILGLVNEFTASSGAESPPKASENILLRHPNITALALAYAEHKITGNSLWEMPIDWFTASDIAEGKAVGLRGVFDKAWQARDVMKTVERFVGPNHKSLGWVLGLVAAGVAYHEEGKLENTIKNDKKKHSKPALNPAASQ